MNHLKTGFRRSPAVVFLSLLLLAAFIPAAPAEPSLKTIKPPQGGKAMYGPVPGETTEAGAMGWILRSIHKEFGEKPQVGKLFQARGTQSVSALFTLTNRNHGNLPWTGMVIVTKTATDHVEGAAVYDESSKFPNSFNPMMKALFASWHPFASTSAGKAGDKAGALPPMQKFTASDNSVSMDYPEGWKPSGHGGTAVVLGPNGEFVNLDAALGGYDTRNPQVQRTMRTVQSGGMPNSVYAKGYYCAWDADISKIFVDNMQIIRKQNKAGPGDFQIISQTPVQSPQGHRSAHIIAHVKPQGARDDQNEREVNAVICLGPPRNMGGYSITLYFTTVPVALAEKERPLLGAMLASFQVNMAVINKEAGDIAAPAIAAIHQIGANAAAQAQAAHEANDIHNSSVYAQWDAQDKRSAAFQNYQLGFTVVSDTGNNAHATLWNADADALVQQHPNQFEYVNTPGYWKGVDY